MFHVKWFWLSFIVFPSFTFCQHIGKTSLEVKDLPAQPVKLRGLEDYLDSFPSSNKLTIKQKEWFYWINYSRDNPGRFWDSVVSPLLVAYSQLNNGNARSLKSDLFNSKQLPLLKPNISLNETALSQAKDLSNSHTTISHFSSSGMNFQQRMVAKGIRFCAGENISVGADNPLLMLVLLYLDNGVEGVGHRKSLLNADFEEMGIGIFSNSDKIVTVIQDFACKQQ